MNNPPVVSDVSIDELTRDPYPAFDRIRDLGSAVWLESAGIYLVTRFDDIMQVERNHDVFASTNPNSLMNQVMGHSLMRKDGTAHKMERAAIEPSFRPGVIKQHWVPKFNEISSGLIDQIEQSGEADLFSAFAAPMSAFALIELLGFKDVAWEDIAWWSQALMDGVGNYQNDPKISERSKAASDAIDVEIDKVLDAHRAKQNPTILSSMAHAENHQSLEQIRANIKVVVGGGLNEPRDAILTMLIGLLQHPDQLAQVRQDRKLYAKAFEESVRWISPIGMYPRCLTQDVVLGDTALKAGDQIGVCIGAANRDRAQFADPEKFDINRPRAQHVGFGAGPHFCAGTWVARLMVGDVAVPMLIDRLANLRLAPNKPPVEKGWVFRGPVSLPAVWDVKG